MKNILLLLLAGLLLAGISFIFWKFTLKDFLYYRGNYNRAKYCTDPRTSYAQKALDSLLADAPPPMMGVIATQAYGCQLPQETFDYGDE